MERRATLSIALALCLGLAAAAAEPVGVSLAPGGSPYFAPELEKLMDAVTLHVSFDAGTALPDMAAGDDYTPQLFSGRGAAGAQFAPGLVGQAMVLGASGAVYPRRGNVTLENRGALALWIKPLDWQRPNDGNTVFAMTTNATFYLQRQGPLRGDEGQVVRHEGVQYLARTAGGRLANLVAGSEWENGRWYLLVANWSWPSFALSINAGPFQSKSLSPSPADEDFGNLRIGDGGPPRGLIDEVLAFRRPLGIDEVKLLYRLGERNRD
jgi:hypothetical protein